MQNNLKPNSMKYLSLAAFAVVMSLSFSSCSKDEVQEPEEDDVCVNIEDEALRNFCYREFDLDHSGKVSTDEAEVVYTIKIDEYTAKKSIKSLKGVDVFWNLESISLENAVLSDIEVLSSMYNLQAIGLKKCIISNIDALYKFKNLQSLNILQCEMPEFDVSLIPNLAFFSVEGTLMSELDFSKNHTLQRITLYPQDPVTLYLPKEMEAHVLHSSMDVIVDIIYEKTEGYALQSVMGNSKVNVVYK